MLVYAPRRARPTGYASWYADLWLRGADHPPRLPHAAPSPPILRRRRAEERLAGAPARQSATTSRKSPTSSAIRSAAPSRCSSRRSTARPRPRPQAARRRGREDLYEAALTVMMRLVFLFSAEERELLLLRRPALRPALRRLHAPRAAARTRRPARRRNPRAPPRCLEPPARHLPRRLRRRRARAPAAPGLRRHALRSRPLPVPRRPRRGHDAGATPPATPLPINNRTVLHLLEALQVLRDEGPRRRRTEARRLSFRGLDIEQIGHVYEGLLDHTARARAGSHPRPRRVERPH